MRSFTVPDCATSADDIVVAMWASTPETSAPVAGGIADAHNGYLDALDTIGQADTAPGGSTLIASPYSTRLRPLTSLEFLTRASWSRAVLLQVDFRVYDVTREPGDPGTQDTVTLQAIVDSVDPSSGDYSLNNALMQSRFRNSEIGGWQPNYFRPDFRVNGQSLIFPALQQSAWGTQHKGDLSMGLPLPFVLEGVIDLKVPKTIEVYAQAAQEVGGKYQRYLVMCTAMFALWREGEQ